MGNRRAYVFSLDAFVAFSLILIAIQTLLVMSSMPSGYYRPLLQAQYLARDVLEVMSFAKPPCTATGCQAKTYLEEVSAYAVRNRCIGNPSCIKPLRNITDFALPETYSYAFTYDNLEGGSWLLYNASADDTNPRANLTFKRVQASAQIFLVGYARDAQRGDSPYCNVACKGWDFAAGGGAGGYSQPENCMVPCDIPQVGFQPGNYSIGLLRLTVWG